MNFTDIEDLYKKSVNIAQELCLILYREKSIKDIHITKDGYKLYLKNKEQYVFFSPQMMLLFDYKINYQSHSDIVINTFLDEYSTNYFDTKKAYSIMEPESKHEQYIDSLTTSTSLNLTEEDYFMLSTIEQLPDYYVLKTRHKLLMETQTKNMQGYLYIKFNDVIPESVYEYFITELRKL